MDRHTKLLNEFSRSRSQAELLNKMQTSRKAIDAGANGSFGYMVKSGSGKGRILKHIKKISKNI